MDYKKNHLKQEYLRQSVMTATPSELVVMLFDACIKNLKLAQLCLNDRRDLEAANTHFLKAQKIIMELTNCLNTSFTLSAQLLPLYEYLLHSIREMNAKKDLHDLDSVLDILGSLRDTWQTVAKPDPTRSSEVS